MKRSRIQPGLGNPIPEGANLLVDERDMGRCLLCGGRGYEKHHRRSRRVIDAHTHCLCNVVTSCRTCHATAHVRGNASARRLGHIVTQFEGSPSRVPLYCWSGWLMLPCDGILRPLSADQVVERTSEPPEVSAAVYRRFMPTHL